MSILKEIETLVAKEGQRAVSVAKIELDQIKAEIKDREKEHQSKLRRENAEFTDYKKDWEDKLSARDREVASKENTLKNVKSSQVALGEDKVHLDKAKASFASEKDHTEKAGRSYSEGIDNNKQKEQLLDKKLAELDGLIKKAKA